MPSTPCKGQRSRWGMARFELETNYDKIQSVIAKTPNFTVAYDALVAEQIVSVTYAAFVRTWKKLQAERAEQYSRADKLEEKAGEAAAQPKERKPLPELNKFTVPTGPDGVREQW